MVTVFSKTPGRVQNTTKWVDAKSTPLIPRTYISWYCKIDPTEVRKYVQKCSKLRKKVENGICLIKKVDNDAILIHTCMKQDQSFLDKSFISEKTIWFEL